MLNKNPQRNLAYFALQKGDQKGLPREAGQNLIELVVVMAVAIIIVGALTFATIASIRNAQFSKNQAQATKLAQEGLEKTRSLRDRDTEGGVIYTISDGQTTSKFSDLWGSFCAVACNLIFNNTSTGLIGGSGNQLETLPPGFKRQIQILDIGDGTSEKQVTSIVSWVDFSGAHQSLLATILRKI